MFQHFAFAFLLLAQLSACSLQQSRQNDSTMPAQTQSQGQQEAQAVHPDSGQAFANQDQLLQAQSDHARKVEVEFAARVKKLLRDDTKGLPHQRFLLLLDNGTTVLVAHDTKYAPKVPLHPGDMVTIKGEYIWNERGGVVHWTHRSDTPRHEGGFIEYAGNRYE
jgi:hypothetical protein